MNISQPIFKTQTIWAQKIQPLRGRLNQGRLDAGFPDPAEADAIMLRKPIGAKLIGRMI